MDLILIFQIAVLLFSVVIHEVSHGFMALKLGDETAKDAGRLTLNPIKHLDLVGSFIVPLLSHGMLAWAKPVPVNPFAMYKDFKYGPLKVALVGPFSNLALAVVFGLIFRFAIGALDSSTLGLLAVIVQINSLLFVFNLLPIPPLDGSKLLTLFLPRKYAVQFESMGLMGMVIVIIVIYFFSDFIFGLSNSLAGFLMGIKI